MITAHMIMLQAAPSAGGSLISTLLLIGPMILIMYFFMIRPQQQARKKHDEMITNIRRGDRVVTAGGIVGKVVRVPDNSEEILVELGENVQVNVVKSMVQDVRSKTQPADNADNSEKK